MKTLHDYIVDAQRKEARFVSERQGEYDKFALSKKIVDATSSSINNVIQPNEVYVTKD